MGGTVIWTCFLFLKNICFQKSMLSIWKKKSSYLSWIKEKVSCHHAVESPAYEANSRKQYSVWFESKYRPTLNSQFDRWNARWKQTIERTMRWGKHRFKPSKAVTEAMKRDGNQGLWVPPVTSFARPKRRKMDVGGWMCLWVNCIIPWKLVACIWQSA